MGDEEFQDDAIDVEAWNLWREGIATGRDEDLAVASFVCATGGMPASLERVAAQGQQIVPDAREYCERVITEEAARGRLNGVYELYARDMGYPEAGEAVRSNVSASALANKNIIDLAGDADNPLLCPLAFHAGAADGVDRADQPPFQPQLSDAEVDAFADACFAANSTLPTVYGYIAGARFGQALGQELQAAIPVSGPRVASAIER